jgi:RimJ/RimL family protein N-acetyltransferase
MYRVVEGDRTRLRPARWGFSEDELRRRYRWSLDDELQYWSGTIPSGRVYGQFKDTIAQRDWPDDGRRISYAILTKGNDLIGMISCYNIDRRHQTGELGVYLGEKQTWGRGYGTDAIRGFLRHLFCDLGFESVYLHTYESNLRAQRSYFKLGFEIRDRRRRFSARLGYHDELEMAVSRDTFARINSLKEPLAAS